MSGLFSRGMVLEQVKEPALSRDLRSFLLPDSFVETGFDKISDPSLLIPREILEIARRAEIIDERDGVPLYEKLLRAMEQEKVMIVADAIDDEPYVSSQLNPLFKLSQQAVGGLIYAAKAVDSRDIQIAVYKNLYDLKLHIPNTLYGVKIKRITGKYPVEARERFMGKDSRDQNVLLVGVCALIHLYRAVHMKQKQTSCFITVAGNCVGNPMNVEVTCGVRVMQVLERCGLIDDPTRIILGGPMSGVCITDPEHRKVEPTTRAVLAFKTDTRDMHYQCVGCAKCTNVCPQRLAPVYLYKASKTRHVRLLRTLDVKDCIGCGTCSYVCPAKLDLTAEILRAKRMINELDVRQNRTLLEQKKALELVQAQQAQEEAQRKAEEEAQLAEKARAEEEALAAQRQRAEDLRLAQTIADRAAGSLAATQTDNAGRSAEEVAP